MKYLATTVAVIILFSGLLAAQPSGELKSALDLSVGRLKDGTFNNVHSLLVSQNGKTILEEYFNGKEKNSLHTLQSQTKSVVALLCGIAIDRGFIENENVPVIKFFPESIAKSDALKASMTIKDVLTMSAGLKWEEMLPPDDPNNDNMNMFRGSRYLDYVLARPMAKPPFTEFKYNSGCPMIIAGIIQKTANMSLDKFAETYLFGPLGIKDYRWRKDATGMPHAGGGLDLKPSDMLKIGELVLNQGQWNGKTIVSKAWIEKAMRSYFKTTFSDSGFGYFWWSQELNVAKGRTTKVLSARGAGGQWLFVVPEFRLVVSFTEGNLTTPIVGPYIVREYILPALGKAPLVLTYVANSGVLAACGDVKILFDALFDKPNPEYRAPAPEVLDKIMKGAPPFDGVGLVLVTHNHPDHFDAGLAVRYLEAQAGATLLAPADAVAEMRKAASDWAGIEPRVIALDLKVGEKERRDIKGITVTGFRTLHSGGLEAPMNLMYLADFGGRRVFHEGDSASKIDEYKAFGLGSEPVDLALVHYWFPFVPDYARLLLEVIKADHVALTHLPVKNESDWPARVDQAKQYFKDLFLLLPGMPDKVMP